MDIENYSIKSVNSYSEKEYPSLPHRGWIKPCLVCSTITSSTIVVNNIFKFYIIK